MASSRSDGAGSNRSVTSKSARKTPSAKPASPPGKPAAAKKRPRKSETGVISVKRAGVLPRQAKAPRVPAPALLPVTEAAIELAAPVSLMESTDEPTLVTRIQPAGAAPVETLDDSTEEIPVADLAAMIAEVSPGAPEVISQQEPAPPIAAVVTRSVDVQPAPVSLPREPEHSRVAAPGGLEWLLSKIRQWTRSRT
jgi:hypothetical protein